MAGMLDLSQLLGGDLGWLGSAAAMAGASDAADTLAQRMRQQNPHVPPPGKGDRADRASFENRFNPAFGSLSPVDPAPAVETSPISGQVPLPQPRPNVAPEGAMPVSLPQSQPQPQSAMQRPAQAAQPSFLDRLGNGVNNNSNMLLALGAGFAGAPSLGEGMHRAFAGAAPFAGQNQTVDALIKRGLPRDVAQAAINNPAIMQQIVAQAFGPKQQKFTTVDHDKYGQPVMGWVDEVNRKAYDLRGNPITSATSNSTSGSPNPDLHGEDFLATHDSAYANKLRGIVQGRLPYPSGPFLRTPQGQRLQDDITQVEPGFSAQTYQQRQKAFNDWYGGGKSQESVRAMRQVATHANALTGSLDRLGNSSFGGRVVNAPLNEIGSAVGSNVEYGPAQLNVHALADELSKLWKGGTNSDTEVRAWEEKFPINGTPAQQRAAMAKAAELYRGGVDALERKHRDSFTSVASSLPPIRDDEFEQTAAQMENWAKGSKPSAAAPATPQAAVAPVAPPQAGTVQKGYRFLGGDPADPARWQKVRQQ